MSRNIEELRSVIDVIDRSICDKLMLRKSAVDRIQSLKDEDNKRDLEREEEIKQRLISDFPELEDTIETLWDHLFNSVE